MINNNKSKEMKYYKINLFTKIIIKLYLWQQNFLFIETFNLSNFNWKWNISYTLVYFSFNIFITFICNYNIYN